MREDIRLPKVIDNLRETILIEARRQLLARGYSKMTIRSVARGCGIAAGTVYNYFKTKYALVASFMLEDWQEALSDMRAAAAAELEILGALGCIYSGIVRFCDTYRILASDEGAARSGSAAFGERHRLLRGQIAALIREHPEARAIAAGDCGFLIEFTAEALVAWAVEGRPFSQVAPILKRLYLY